MKKYILETYRLLIELKNENKVPKHHQRDLDRCIRNLEEIIEKKDYCIGSTLCGLIASIFKSIIFPP